MNENVDINMILQFGLKCLGIFALIFLLAVLTPWMAKHVDSWIAKYREAHQTDKAQDGTPVRSIYELPPEPEQPDSGHAKKKAVVRKSRKS